MLQKFVDRMLDERTHTNRILQYLVTPYPKQGISSFSQIRVATLIMLATFVGLMVFPIHLDDQLQPDTAEICRIWRNWILTTKLLLSASSITEDFPHSLHEFVGSLTLVPGERCCIRFAPRSSC